MEYAGPKLMDIVSSITSTHFRRIFIEFRESTTDTQLESAIKYKCWREFDEAISRLADRASDNGRRLQLKLRAHGNFSTELINLVFPGLVERGCLSVVKTSYFSSRSKYCLME
jgi:hypothetical protein